MTESWPCPACRTEVKAARIDPLGSTPELMRTRCGACDVALLRGVDDDPARGWIVEGPGTDTSIRQSLARLRAYAKEQNLEFEEPKEDQGVWRCYLWMKRGPDDPKDQRTAPVWGSGRSEREALVSAVVEAESKGMPRVSDAEVAP